MFLIYFRTLQRDNLRLIANVLVEHLRGVRQLSMSLLFHLQCRIPVTNLNRTTDSHRNRSHLQAF